MARAGIGDVVEMEGQKGRYFAHYVLRRPGWGPLMWFFGKSWPHAPEDLRLAVAGTPTLIAFFPLARSVNLGLVKMIGRVPVTSERQSLPLFRDGTPDPTTGRVENWWLWDGEREWLAGNLSPEQEHLPLRQIVNAAYFLEYVEGNT